MDQLTIAPIGDIQWSGENGPTAKEQLKKHIDHCLELGAYFVGMGDAIDFASPSNRARLKAAGLYDTAQAVMKEKAWELTQEVYEKFLAPTKGRWLGWVEGHHFFEADGETSDEYLCDLLGAPFLGTSAFVRIEPLGFTLWMHHGLGGGQLPGSGLNRLYHLAAGLEGADIYLMGHNTKVVTSRLSRPFPVWGKRPDLQHKDIWLVNTGGFSKSNIQGHRAGAIKRGDYAEQAMMTPSPLTAPLITIKPSNRKGHQPDIRVAV